MVKMIIVCLFASFVVTNAQNMYRTDRIDQIEVVDVSSGDDSTIASNVRAIKADVDGLVKLKINPRNGNDYVTVEYLPEGVWVPIGNIVRVYRYITGTTDATTQVYDTTATAVIGIKIGR